MANHNPAEQPQGIDTVSIPHSGQLEGPMQELPTRRFDKTLLEEAHEQNLITIPDSPPADPEMEQKSSKNKAVIGGIAAAAAITAGAAGFAMGNSGGENNDTPSDNQASPEVVQDGQVDNILDTPPSETVITVDENDGNIDTSEVLNANDLPEELFRYDVQIEREVLRVINNNSPERRNETEAADRNFDMWRGLVSYDLVLDEDTGERFYIELQNPIQVLVDDPSGSHDQIALWAAYHPSSQRWISVERGYRNDGTGNNFNNNAELAHWKAFDNPNSGQEVSGKPWEIVSGTGLRLHDNFESIIRGDSEFAEVISYARVITDINDSRDVERVVDLSSPDPSRDYQVVRDLYPDEEF